MRSKKVEMFQEIAELTSKITELEGKLRGQETSYAQLEADYETLGFQAGILGCKVDDLTSKIGELEDKINDLKDKNLELEGQGQGPALETEVRGNPTGVTATASSFGARLHGFVQGYYINGAQRFWVKRARRAPALEGLRLDAEGLAHEIEALGL
jgi:chromosome segregation ATPase